LFFEEYDVVEVKMIIWIFTWFQIEKE
jgi:hypothetical protein